MLNPQVESTNNQLRNITERINTNFDIGVIAFLFNKSKYIILGFFLISFFIVFLYLRYSQPIYESKAIVQIDDGNRADNILKLNDVGNSDDVIAKAIEQIRSKIFLKRVVEKLDISVNYFSEGTFKNNELYHATPYLVKLNFKKGRIFGQKIYVDINESLTAGNITIGGQTFRFKENEWLRTPDFDINVYINDKLEKKVARQVIEENKGFYFIVSDVDAVTADLQSKLDVRLISDLARTILIKVKDVNSAKATDVVNAITEEFLTYDVERKSESSTNILSFIDTQLNVVYNELKNSEENLQKFKREKNFGYNDKFLSTDLVRFTTIEDQMMKVELEEKIISEVQDNIAKNRGIDIYQLVSIISGTDYEAAVKEITQTIQKLLNEKENLLYAVTPNSDNIKQINYKIDNQKKLLMESLDAVKLKYKSKYKNLLEKASDYKSKFAEHPENEVEFSRLNRLYAIREKYYTMLLEKKTEFSISKAGYVSKNIILEKALGVGVLVSPNKKNAIMIAFLASLLLSASLVFVRYLFHDKIYSLSDITKYSSGEVSLLGVIPRYESDIPISQLIVDKNPKALISEAFRTIRTNLNFIDNTEGSKIVSVTSTISGEGKTFVAINIAGVLAFTGKKVIIIDLDMRKPKIHKGFGVANDKGMSTILTEANTVEECFRESHLPNLKFITAGPPPPNPSELILNKKLDEVIIYLKTLFDYIVIDNAPVGLVTDGIATIQKANYPIYVFRAGYSRKMFTQNLDRLKNETAVKNLSVILNDVDVSRKIYSYNYGYGYGYGYGYNSGYYTEEPKQNKKRKFS